MTSRQTTVPHLGTLAASGHSSIWEGTLSLAQFRGRFDVRVFGGREGPTPRQADAIGRVVTGAEAIRGDATAPLVQYLERLVAAGLLPPDAQPSAATVWDQLSACFLEVHPADYEPSGEVFISLGFELPWDVGGHLVHLRTREGAFVEVYSE
jgi:hypothetical protein